MELYYIPSLYFFVKIMEKENTILKKDTFANWAKAINFIPKENEIIMYTDIFPNGIKIGDGKTKIIDLPFINNYDYVVEDDILIIKKEEMPYARSKNFQN